MIFFMHRLTEIRAALGSRSPLQAMKDWYKIKPELLKTNPYQLTGCDKRANQSFSAVLMTIFEETSRRDY